jgi:4-hydroxy-tetrahydrodipicolinate reductase
MLRLIISGVNGKMGKVLRTALQSEPDIQILAGFDKEIGSDPLPFKLYTNPEDCMQDVDVVIDFSHFSAIPSLLEYCVRTKTAVVIATTALGEAETAQVRDASERVAIFHSANMSLGINLVSRMAKLAMPSLESDFNVEIIEKHHNKKVDSPSGTALLLAEAVNDACAVKKDFVFGRHGKDDQCRITDLGIHAVRGGSLPGQHTVLFCGPDEVIEVTHTVYAKNVFAQGAIKAARFLAGKPPGVYSMEDLIGA